MELASYATFGQLRFGYFVAMEESMEALEGIQCAVGLTAAEGYAFTFFAARNTNPWETAQISLHFRQDCSQELGRRILKAIGLPLAPGMSMKEVEETLRDCTLTSRSSGSHGSYDCVCGDKWPYCIRCSVDGQEGLVAIDIYRKDYRDEWQAVCGS